MPDSETSGTGSHYVPSFTRVKQVDGYPFQETACARFVGWSAIAPAHEEPTCSECREWLGLKDEEKA